MPGVGDFPLFADTAHSIELNVRTTVPEWGGTPVRMPLEQDAVITKDEPDSSTVVRPTTIRLIK